MPVPFAGLEAQTWFVHRLTNGLSWPRTPELKPAGLNLDEHPVDEDASWLTAVDFVVQARRQSLPSTRVATLGRVLTYKPGESLADGAADAVTAGFFDVNNTPPWDTWIGFRDGTLYAWIPQALEILVQDAIDVNPERCLAWESPGWTLRRRREGGLEARCIHGIGHRLDNHSCDLCCQNNDFPADQLRAPSDFGLLGM